MLIRMGCTLLLVCSVAGPEIRTALHAREASYQSRVAGAERRLEDFLAVPFKPGRVSRAGRRRRQSRRVIGAVAAADSVTTEHPAPCDALYPGLGFRGEERGDTGLGGGLSHLPRVVAAGDRGAMHLGAEDVLQGLQALAPFVRHLGAVTGRE